MKNRKKILVTGATGFLGREFLRLSAADFEIYAVSRAGTPPGAEGVRTIALDLSRETGWGKLPRRVDAIVHLAQSRHFREFPEKADDIYAVNVRSTLRLLEYARRAGVGKFVLASTGSVYGASERPSSETSPVSPDGFYALSKLHAEQLASQYQAFFRSVILRYFFIYGPGQENRLIPGLIQKIQQDQPVTLAGERGMRFNPLYVSDAAAALARALDEDTEGVFNVAGITETDLKTVAELLAKYLGRTPQYQMTAPGYTHFLAHTRKMRENLKLIPQVALEDGLRKTTEAVNPVLSR